MSLRALKSLRALMTLFLFVAAEGGHGVGGGGAVEAVAGAEKHHEVDGGHAGQGGRDVSGAWVL